MLTDDELMRYSRQILLPAFDVAGQARLKSARVLMVGAGGLGCPVGLYLAAAGVGHLTLADDDVIELANLQRQIAFENTQLGEPKAQALAEQMRRINPLVTVEALTERLEGDNLLAQVQPVIWCSIAPIIPLPALLLIKPVSKLECRWSQARRFVARAS